MTRPVRGLATCPWCDWEAEVEAPDRDTVITVASALVEAHAAEAGHRIKAGRKPRVGYLRGKPVS